MPSSNNHIFVRPSDWEIINKIIACLLPRPCIRLICFDTSWKFSRTTIEKKSVKFNDMDQFTLICSKDTFLGREVWWNVWSEKFKKKRRMVSFKSTWSGELWKHDQLVSFKSYVDSWTSKATSNGKLHFNLEWWVLKATSSGKLHINLKWWVLKATSFGEFWKQQSSGELCISLEWWDLIALLIGEFQK